MAHRKTVIVCKIEGSIHEGYRCVKKLERPSAADGMTCAKCKEVDTTSIPWG